MTDDQWLELQVGDLIRDHVCGGAIRTVQSVSRVSGKRGQRGKTRTSIRVNNLKEYGRTTILFSTEDRSDVLASPDGKRFEFIRHAAKGDKHQRSEGERA